MNARANVNSRRVAIAAMSIALAAALMIAGCQWRPETAEEKTGALNISTLGLDDDAEIRVRFYHADDDVGQFIDPDYQPDQDSVQALEGEFGGVAYPEGLPGAEAVDGRAGLVFEVTGSAGSITIAGVPANTPLNVLVERQGAEDDRLNELIIQHWETPAVEVDYTTGVSYVSHIGVSEDTIELDADEDGELHVSLARAALSTVHLPEAQPFGATFEIVAVPLDNDLNLEQLEQLGEDDGDLTAEDVELINNWYEQEVRGRDDVHVLRPALDAGNEPREGFEGSVFGMLTGRNVQIITTDYDGERLPDYAFGELENSDIMGWMQVYRPIMLSPGEERAIEEPLVELTISAEDP